ncbi:hypothetical protein DPMN_180254 [Dreissena polymorpha]|uniref:Uncharacterized protein n=1 Tax=Dreissena polymorpha TaxID=45954 RepID=A0A9D4EGC3_DREPO|nr:hypothetical protein DPMN_180254 [Dreissena polymorpha]
MLPDVTVGHELCVGDNEQFSETHVFNGQYPAFCVNVKGLATVQQDEYYDGFYRALWRSCVVVGPQSAVSAAVASAIRFRTSAVMISYLDTFALTSCHKLLPASCRVIYALVLVELFSMIFDFIVLTSNPLCSIIVLWCHP